MKLKLPISEPSVKKQNNISKSAKINFILVVHFTILIKVFNLKHSHLILDLF